MKNHPVSKRDRDLIKAITTNTERRLRGSIPLKLLKSLRDAGGPVPKRRQCEEEEEEEEDEKDG